MRVARYLVGGAALCTATAAVPATTDCSTGSTAGNCSPSSIGQVINHTISDITGQPIDPYAGFFSQVFDALPQNTWLNFALANIPGWGVDFKGSGATYHGGGGADDGWTADDELCGKIKFRFDMAGQLIVPSLPLAPALGAPIIKGQSAFKYTSAPSGIGHNDLSKSAATSVLWYSHNYNLAFGDKRDWLGVWRVRYDGAGNPIFDQRNQRFYKTGTALNAARTATTFVVPTTHRNISQNGDCPLSGQAGGDMTHHAWETGSYPGGCTSYVPNSALSSSGFAYADEVGIPFTESAINDWRSTTPFGKCAVSRAALAALVEFVWKEASKKPGYDGPPPQTVCNDCVKTGGEDPELDDLVDPPTMPTKTGETETPTPDPEPSPTPTPTSSDAPDYTHVPVSANEPVAPEIDWWPDLPEVSLNLGSPQCPTYDLSIAEWGWNGMILDSHCTLIEANKALISTIMILVFTMIGLRTVLEA